MLSFIWEWLEKRRKQKARSIIKKMIIRQDKLGKHDFEVLSYSVLKDQSDGESMACGLLLMKDGRMLTFDGVAGREDKPVIIGEEDLPAKMKAGMKGTPEYLQAAGKLGLKEKM